MKNKLKLEYLKDHSYKGDAWLYKNTSKQFTYLFIHLFN